MKKSILLLIVLFSGASLLAQKIVKGQVSYVDTPLVNAEVSVSGSGEIVKTNIEGAYEISVKEGEVLVFSYPSMRTMEIVVEDVTRILNIQMNPEVNQLDEVVVKKTVRKSQKQLQEEYYINKNLINTAFGIIDKDRVSYRVKVIQGKDLPIGGIDFASALQGRVPGLRVQRLANNPLEPAIFLRASVGVGFVAAIYDVDGLVYTAAPTFLMVENIERIGIVTGLNATARYGFLGNGGVIVINTKNAVYGKTDSQIPMDLARLRNNYFDETSVLNSDDTAKDAPLFLTQLRNSETEEQAISLYEQQIKSISNSYTYILDAYDYFVSSWKNQEFADEILETNFGQFQDNPLALKALAYFYQGQDKFAEALEVYKDITILRPNYAQSYRDLANSYREVGEYKRAASLYVRYGYLIEEGFLREQGTMFSNIINREFNNLIALKGKKILPRKELRNLVLDEDFKGTRLVFEWNDSEAEFELQFVNPENQYYSSEHSLMADANRIKDEKLSGYSSEEYLIDDTLRGTWMVNIKYLGNKSLTPSYIKATIYHNFGSASQRKETKLFKMSLRDVNQQWFKVSNAATIVSN
ncbi:carboxypeptidase-like regulatory domain-containing protein [bacterium]|nr:carboxypeptidase-like regulatory domain-containing protein [bacterium]